MFKNILVFIITFTFLSTFKFIFPKLLLADPFPSFYQYENAAFNPTIIVNYLFNFSLIWIIFKLNKLKIPVPVFRVVTITILGIILDFIVLFFSLIILGGLFYKNYSIYPVLFFTSTIVFYLLFYTLFANKYFMSKSTKIKYSLVFGILSNPTWYVIFYEPSLDVLIAVLFQLYIYVPILLLIASLILLIRRHLNFVENSVIYIVLLFFSIIITVFLDMKIVMPLIYPLIYPQCGVDLSEVCKITFKMAFPVFLLTFIATCLPMNYLFKYIKKVIVNKQAPGL